MKKVLFTAITLLLPHCATKPDGTRTLSPMIEADIKDQKTAAQDVTQGRPIFIKTYAYPQILDSGDVWSGGWVQVFIGREQMSFDNFLNPDKAEVPEKKDAE